MLYPTAGKEIFIHLNSNTDTLIVKDYHIMKKSRINTVDKLHSREIYSFLLQM